MNTQAWALAIGSVVVALISLYGVVYTARQGRSAAAESARREAAGVTEAARIRDREVLVEQLSDQLDKLWPRLEKMDKTIDQQREQIATQHTELHEGHQRITQLERENADLRQHYIVCGENVEKMNARLDDYVGRYRVAISYVAQLRAFIAAHLPDDAATLLPHPPEGLQFDLNDPMHTSPDPPPPGWPRPRGLPSDHGR